MTIEKQFALYNFLHIRNAMLIGEVMGIQFFEHPTLGDDCGLIAVRNGRGVFTDWYELPSKEEMEDPDDFLITYGWDE